MTGIAEEDVPLKRRDSDEFQDACDELFKPGAKKAEGCADEKKEGDVTAVRADGRFDHDIHGQEVVEVDVQLAEGENGVVAPGEKVVEVNEEIATEARAVVAAQMG